MKSKRLLNIAVLSLCSILTSCGVFYIDLGNKYAWLEDRVIYKISKETENCLYGNVIIRPQVLNYDYDDQYIIVYQVYDGSDYYDISAKQDKAELLYLGGDYLTYKNTGMDIRDHLNLRYSYKW